MTLKHNEDTLKVYTYHEATKHHPYRYAASLGYMDWENEPSPFRFYNGATRLKLPLIEKDEDIPYQALYVGRADKKEPFNLKTLAAFLELGMGLSAWKKHGQSEWVLRMNPSSGNLHPTECYVMLPSIENLSSCVVHYNPLLHCLELRTDIKDVAEASMLKIGGFGIILTSIYWREAWKYGERAFRYCNHDVGHALAALRISANLLGWKLVIQTQISNSNLDSFLGFEDIDWVECEEEHADCLCWVNVGATNPGEIRKFFTLCNTLKYDKPPNRLSNEHIDWEIIEAVSYATRAPAHAPSSNIMRKRALKYHNESSFTAQAIIRRRRSAQAYNISKSEIERNTFLSILERTMPEDHAPFDCFPYEPHVHLVLFVHNVKEVQEGLYLFVRNPEHEEELHSLLSKEFVWQQQEKGFPMYLLQKGELRDRAKMVSCQQDIAGDSAFSLGMLARFQPVLEKTPWMYPRLFWETGMIGQILYLEAEAHGLRGTGIGCFFDDMIHDMLRLEGKIYQDLYHFTIGFPLEDKRIQTIEPYFHLDKAT
ncbi:MAG: SagB/ThcOx family dehydrogenase [Candidatus Brocadiaceae bacterium]|nr:SagB/ThcOx family dehydrogenase [Candidatus Brocadiaceae bacterium]